MNSDITKFSKALCSASFLTAAALAFTSLAIQPDHEITAGVLMAIAQFLLFCASILGIDYKIKQILRKDA